MSYSVHDIANNIILSTDVERGDAISNLKLQKLLYYMQGYHLAFFDNVFFPEPLEAWTYGPVVPDVYRRFKENKYYGIVLDSSKVQPIQLTSDENDMFWQVMSEYGKFSAIKLMDMTHQEDPWKEAFERVDKQIDLKTMKAFFKNLVDE